MSSSASPAASDATDGNFYVASTLQSSGINAAVCAHVMSEKPHLVIARGHVIEVHDNQSPAKALQTPLLTAHVPGHVMSMTLVPSISNARDNILVTTNATQPEAHLFWFNESTGRLQLLRSWKLKWPLPPSSLGSQDTMAARAHVVCVHPGSGVTAVRAFNGYVTMFRVHEQDELFFAEARAEALALVTATDDALCLVYEQIHFDYVQGKARHDFKRDVRCKSVVPMVGDTNKGRALFTLPAGATCALEPWKDGTLLVLCGDRVHVLKVTPEMQNVDQTQDGMTTIVLPMRNPLCTSRLDAQHLLVGDAQGSVLMLFSRSVDDTTPTLDLDAKVLGHAPVARDLCVLEDLKLTQTPTALLVLSKHDDAQVIQFQSDGTMDVLATDMYRGRVLDLDMMTGTRQGSRVIGAFDDASGSQLKVLSKGVSVTEMASRAFPGARNVFALTPPSNNANTVWIVISDHEATRMLRVDGTNVDVVENGIPGFVQSERTLVCAVLSCGALCQVTTSRVTLSFPDESVVTTSYDGIDVATVDGNRLFLAHGSRLWSLDLGAGTESKLHVEASVTMPEEVCALDAHQNLLLVGTWNDNELMVCSQSDLRTLAAASLGAYQARSLAIMDVKTEVGETSSKTDANLKVLCGVANGDVQQFTLQSAQDSDSTSYLNLQRVSVMRVSTTPVKLQRMPGSSDMFVADEAPCMVRMMPHGLEFTSVNTARPVQAMAAARFSGQDCTLFVDGHDLSIVQLSASAMENKQVLTSRHVDGKAWCVSYHPGQNVVFVNVVKDKGSACLEVCDANSLEVLHTFDFFEDEDAWSMCPVGPYMVIGTGRVRYVKDGNADNSLTSGHVLVFRPRRGVEAQSFECPLVAAQYLKGCGLAVDALTDSRFVITVNERAFAFHIVPRDQAPADVLERENPSEPEPLSDSDSEDEAGNEKQDETKEVALEEPMVCEYTPDPASDLVVADEAIQVMNKTNVACRAWNERTFVTSDAAEGLFLMQHCGVDDMRHVASSLKLKEIRDMVFLNEHTVLTVDAQGMLAVYQARAKREYTAQHVDMVGFDEEKAPMEWHSLGGFHLSQPTLFMHRGTMNQRISQDSVQLKPNSTPTLDLLQREQDIDMEDVTESKGSDSDVSSSQALVVANAQGNAQGGTKENEDEDEDEDEDGPRKGENPELIRARIQEYAITRPLAQVDAPQALAVVGTQCGNMYAILRVPVEDMTFLRQIETAVLQLDGDEKVEVHGNLCATVNALKKGTVLPRFVDGDVVERVLRMDTEALERVVSKLDGDTSVDTVINRVTKYYVLH